MKDKLTPLVVFKGMPDGKIARIFGSMPASMHFCLSRKGMDEPQRV